MSKPKTVYAILRTKVLRAGQLEAAYLHNTRAIPVPNADPTKPNGHRVVRGGTTTVFSAVATRINDVGAVIHKNRIMAAEFLLGFSDMIDPMPTEEELVERGLRFLDDTFGRDNVVRVDLHTDERTPHLHAIAVPICEGRTPGRPAKKRSKFGQERAKKKVSWNQFSGAHLVNYRRPKRAKTTRTKQRLPKGPAVYTNAVMAGWQTGWAATWTDYCLRRGIPSKRRHLSMRLVHAEQARISGLAESASAELLKALELSDADVSALREARSSQEARGLMMDIARRGVGHATSLLADLAQRGIQLRSEREARADLADRAEALRNEHSILMNKLTAIGDLRQAEPAGEMGQPSRDTESSEGGGNRSEVDIPDLIASLPDADFNRLCEHRRRARGVEQRPRLSAPEGHRQPTPQPELDFK